MATSDASKSAEALKGSPDELAQDSSTKTPPWASAATWSFKDLPDTLDRRVHDLPQELQDMILDFVLAAVPKEVAIFEPWNGNPPAYKPPVQLQISRATRKKVAKVFYSTTCFYVEDLDNYSPPFKQLSDMTFKWLRSLTPEHRLMIQEMRIDFEALDPYNDEYQSSVLMDFGTMEQGLKAQNLWLAGDHVLKRQFDKPGGKVFETIWLTYDELEEYVED